MLCYNTRHTGLKRNETVVYSSLWSKLISYGINGKVMSVIYNMYSQAKSCVMNGKESSELFSCNMGVRQGENLSPFYLLYT